MTDTAITRLYVGSVVAVAGGVMPLDVVQAGLPISGLDVEVSRKTLLALLPVFVLLLGLIVYSLVDLARAPSVRFLPKPVWAVVIVLVSAPFGALAYLVLGRSRDGVVDIDENTQEQRAGLTGRRVSRHGRGIRL